MQGSQSTGQDFAHLKELIENIEIAMLTTTDTDGTLRSRPLQTVGVEDDGAIGRMYALAKGLATGDRDAVGENRKVNT